MSNRRRLARERLEIYLVHLFLAYRALIWTSALLTLGFTLAVMFLDARPAAGLLLFALYLLLLGSSYNVVVYTARAAAWVATLGEHE